MFSKKGPSFQKVAVSDSDEHRDAVRKKCWTPEAIRPPLLIILLCFVLTLIALLQVASSKSVDTAHITSPTKSAVQKRQLIVSTRTYSGFQETITATTITWQPSTYTYSSGKITYSPTTQTISGTTESLPGYTSYIYETFLTSFGTIGTQLYEVITSAGDTSTENVTFPSAMTSAAYPGTATSNTPSTSASSEATPPNAYLQGNRFFVLPNCTADYFSTCYVFVYIHADLYSEHPIHFWLRTSGGGSHRPRALLSGYLLCCHIPPLHSHHSSQDLLVSGLCLYEAHRTFPSAFDLHRRS
ncbi:hypothetical protein LTR06_011238 [Exophiala xenobiotica]|nr:hypothetical protein LTR06_011238 [Exophiala xenobiotica]